MFGMKTGALDTHYRLGSASDAVLTRIFGFFARPAEFAYAIIPTHAAHLFRALLGNTASLMISELMGDRTIR